MKLSLIVPCYNEEENIAAFQNAVMQTFCDCGYDFEIIFIDDGSTDATLSELHAAYQAQDCPIKVVSFSRNFGKEAGILAGLRHAIGEYISIIDADLQQDPKFVRKMVQILDEDKQFDMVAAYQDSRNESKVLKFFKKFFYKTINKLSDVNLRSDASDFRTFRKKVAESILQLGEYHRFSKGIFAWVGYNTCFIPYTVNKRNAGKTKWNFGKLVNYAVDGIIGYSIKPLRIATFLGTLTGIAAMFYLVFVVLQKLIFGIAIPGYATIIVLILFLGGIQLFCIGIIGEYVGRIFEQSKDRPVYIEKEFLDYSK